jgi:tetratricopeptide (TPR) repeat protein
MYIRFGWTQEAEPLLSASQAYFEGSGLGPRAGIGLKAQGFAAETRGDDARAYELYERSLAQFTASGAVLEAAEARIRVATAAFSLGRQDEAGQLLEESFLVFAEHGLGLHCAQVDFWHARLLESALDPARPDPHRLTEALRLAAPSALAEVAAGEGVSITPPPRLRYEPGGRIALEDCIVEAESRYGRRIRDDRVLPL